VELPGAEMGKVVVRFPPEASGYGNSLIVFITEQLHSSIAVSVGLAISGSWVYFLPGQSCVTTLGKLFTPICLCHQAV